MKYKIFTAVNGDSLLFTKEELEKLLDEVYDDGYKSGFNAGRAGWAGYYSWISNTPQNPPIYLDTPHWDPYKVTCTDPTKIPISLTTSTLTTNGSNTK